MNGLNSLRPEIIKSSNLDDNVIATEPSKLVLKQRSKTKTIKKSYPFTRRQKKMINPIIISDSPSRKQSSLDHEKNISEDVSLQEPQQ